MISLTLAQELKEAGLVWPASTNDFFAVPDRGMDERVFVLSEMPANLDVFRGWPVVTFYGTAEWALDYILTAEVVWLPREDQLRETLTDILARSSTPGFSLTYDGSAYTCALSINGQPHAIAAQQAGDAYAKALLLCLQTALVT